MNNQYTPNDAGLPREEWLRQARTGPVDRPTDDDFSRRAVRGLGYAESEPALRQSLDRIDSAISRFVQATPGPARSRFFFRLNPRLRVAATVALILALAAVVRLFFSAPSDQALFTQYFEPIESAVPLTGNLRNAVSPTDLKDQALRLYDGRQFREAAPLLADYLARHPDDEPVRLCYGITLLATRQWEAAVGQLERIAQSGTEPAFGHTAGWYLALGYLRSGDRMRAAEVLRTLTGPDGSRTYGARAETLLKKLGAGDANTR